MIMVKTMMAHPKLLKKRQYNSTRLLIMGLTMPSSQSIPIISTALTLLIL